MDGSELYQREDDKSETVLKRIEVYTAQTAPLIAHYKNQGLLLEVDGTLDIEDVSGQLLKALGSK